MTMNSDPLERVETLPYELTFDEFIRGYRAFTRRIAGRGMLIQLITWCAGLAALRAYFGVFPFGSTYVVVLIAIYVGVTLLTPYRVRRSLRKAFDARFGNEETVTRFDEAGLNAETATASTLIRWSGLTHFVDRADELLVFRTVRRPISVPRRAFRNDHDFAAARRWCEARVGYTSEGRGFAVTPLPEAVDGSPPTSDDVAAR